MPNPPAHDARQTHIGCAVVTVGDGRDGAAQAGGQVVRSLLEEAGHRVVQSRTVRDSALQIKGELAMLGETSGCQCIFFIGGTEIGVRDATYDTIEKMLDRRLDGFGELFRYLMYQEIGAAAITARAAAGLYRGRVVFSLPRTESSIRLAMARLVLPEMGPLVASITPRL